MLKAITSLEGFIRKIAKLSEQNTGIQLLYRGHSSIQYETVPSVFRNVNHVSAEHLMIRQLIAQQPQEFRADQGIFDQLVRAQHYGLPTRLLDVSLNPLVALYFAVCSNSTKRGSVVVVKPAIGKQRYFDSDVVSCLSALSLLTQGEKDEIRVACVEALKKADKDTWLVNNADVAQFNAMRSVAKLIQLVRHEKSDFRPIVQPIDFVRPVVVTPRKIHSRIIAQSGSFIIFGLSKKATKVNAPHIEFEEFHIDMDAKQKFLKELAQVGITESALFPEIEKAALSIKRRYE
jgi:hypothetical protein